MSEQSGGSGIGKGLLITGVIAAAAIGGYLLWKKSAATTAAATKADALKTLKNPAATTAQKQAALIAAKAAANPTVATLLSKIGQLITGKTTPPKPPAAKEPTAPKGGVGGGPSSGPTGSGGGQKGTPKTDQFGNDIGTTVNNKGDYIEKNDPTTLYDKNGNVKGDLDPETGMFLDKNGNVVATEDGTTSIDAGNGDGTYMEISDPTTLYNVDGSVAGNLNPETGMMENANGDIVATADGSTVEAVGDNGDYLQNGVVYSQATGEPTGQSAADFVQRDDISFNDQTLDPSYTGPTDIIDAGNGDGTYMDANDPTTLYDAAGNPIGDLNTDTGMFEDQNGNPIATSDGAAIQGYDDVTNTYMQDGVVYSNDTGEAVGQDASGFVNTDTSVGDATPWYDNPDFGGDPNAQLPDPNAGDPSVDNTNTADTGLYGSDYWSYMGDYTS